MQNVTTWSTLGLSALLLTMGACHNRPGARDGRGHDHDRDNDGVRDSRELDHDRDHDEHHDEHAEVGSGRNTAQAVRAIAKARCNREERCGNIAPDKDYASVNACEDKISTEWSSDLNKYECPKGIVQANLDACIANVKAEDCGNPFDVLARIAKCDASDICDGD